MSPTSPDLTAARQSSAGPLRNRTPAWLSDAVIYEIYPQSFADSDGDGIGDLHGAIAKLDYLQWLGIDTVWFNPLFASPFRDAGYDVSDYLTIAPRYGTNDDMIAFIAEAQRRGIRVILDLVAGHTSVDHAWFQHSATDPTDDRYIWADRPAEGFVPSPGTRPGWMHETHPDCVLMPESDESGHTTAGLRAGFDADFLLVIQPEHSALFNNGTTGLLPWQDATEPCYFDADGAGSAALARFLTKWDARLRDAGDDRLLVLSSADHDFTRLATGPRTAAQLAAAFTFLLTWGSIPSIYYGDEIGMRNLEGLGDKEGTIWNPRFNRAGCRTPMQWDDALPNAGFSTADAGALYLPQDPDPARPTVAAQIEAPDSILTFVHDLLALRRATPALRTRASRRVLSTGYPLVYLRGDTHLVVVNPRRESARVELDLLEEREARLLLGRGSAIRGRAVEVDGFGHGVYELAGASSENPCSPPREHSLAE